MRKRSDWFVLVAALCLVLTPFLSYADKWGTITIPADKPIKIGLGALLSGPYVSAGIDIKNGAEMAVEEKSTLMGYPLALQPEDDGCAAAPSVSAAKKLCNNPLVVGVVGYTCSGGSKVASDVHNNYKVVMISPSSTAVELTVRDIPIFFRTCFNDKMQAERAAAFAISHRWTKVAVLHDKDVYGQGLAEGFARNIQARGGKVVAMEGIAEIEKDVTPLLKAIKPSKPQLIYYGGYATAGVLILRQMEQLGLKGTRFMGGDACHTEDFLLQTGRTATDVCYVTGAVQPDPAWEKRFEAKYGARLTHSAQAYDAVNVLIMAVEKVAKKRSDGSLIIGKKALRDAIAAAKLKGVTGEITFEPCGDRTGSVVAVYKVVEENGKSFFKQMVF